MIEECIIPSFALNTPETEGASPMHEMMSKYQRAPPTTGEVTRPEGGAEGVGEGGGGRRRMVEERENEKRERKREGEKGTER